ncbi:hypothetical protein F5884DRAFT_119433 [Xylogone sp. PMI_703]|nr:hypothetical protein F5884DRAFT_119433 [Xylogone sp. PMI_703]
MIFDQSTDRGFNLIREVWVRIDISNAASFNGMIAHAAAHRACMRGKSILSAALEYKLEALSLVNTWLQDPTLAVGDDVLSGVLRLLTFERHWGTEEEWLLHLSGLRQIVANRGGLIAFQDNWRLKLLLELVLSMSKPSWFYASNSPAALSPFSIEPTVSTFNPNQLVIDEKQKLQSLWFLSFIEDLRTIIPLPPKSQYTKRRTTDTHEMVMDAICCINDSLQKSLGGDKLAHDCKSEAIARRKCFLCIAIILKESKSSSRKTATSKATVAFGKLTTMTEILDNALRKDELIWKTSVEALQNFLFTSPCQPDSEKAKYVEALMSVAGSLKND